MASEIIQKILGEKPYTYLYHMHLPKIGGVTIRKKLGANSNFIDGEHKFCVKDIPQESFIPWTKSGMKVFPSFLDDTRFSRSITFAVIRNPFDWLVSYYYHYSGSYDDNSEHRGWAGCVDYHGFNSFNEFIGAYCDPTFKWHIPPLKNFIPSQLFDHNGRCRADFVLFNEDLDSALDVVSKHFGLKINNNVGRLKINTLKPNREHIYSDDLVEQVREKCKRELDLFGYDFDGFSEKSIKVPYDGVCLDMSEVKYDIYNDELIVVDANKKNVADLPINEKTDYKSIPTFWPQYHFQRAESLYNERKYTDAKNEIDLLMSKTIGNSDVTNDYLSIEKDRELTRTSNFRNSFSSGADIDRYQELKLLIDKKLQGGKTSNRRPSNIRRNLYSVMKRALGRKG